MKEKVQGEAFQGKGGEKSEADKGFWGGGAAAAAGLVIREVNTALLNIRSTKKHKKLWAHLGAFAEDQTKSGREFDVSTRVKRTRAKLKTGGKWITVKDRKKSSDTE